MSYSYDKFLRTLTLSDRNIQIQDNNGIVKWTIEPFSVINSMVSNNILKINVLNRVILIPFSSQNEAKLALEKIQLQIDNLRGRTPDTTDKGYLVYIAELSQSGTADPVANVLVNELSSDPIVWTRNGILIAGLYIGTLAGAFVGKTQVIPPQNSYNFISDFDVYGAGKQDENTIYLASGKQSLATGIVTPADELLYADISFIEIRVYS